MCIGLWPTFVYSLMESQMEIGIEVTVENNENKALKAEQYMIISDVLVY